MHYDTKAPFHSMVDVKNGTVARQIFADEAIYQLELERIFARCWNFMCHESQIPKPGDFFLSYIGEESVIATRDKKGQLQVFLNSCRHRGNAVCRAEQGNTRSFLCTYHGWTFDLEGKLIGVPGYKDLYHEQLDRSQWGLIPAGKVQSYKGFVFATMDAEAPDLEEFLGPVGRMGIEFIASRGDLEIVNGVQKNLIGCNWKLAVDNLFDWYHVDISHASAMQNGYLGRDAQVASKLYDPKPHRTIVGEYGHAIGGPRMTPELWDANEQAQKDGVFDRNMTLRTRSPLWRNQPQAKEALGEVGRDSTGHPSIFPNFWVTSGNQVCLRLPKGPNQTELWWFTLLPKEYSKDEREARIYNANHTFGPAGMLEQDDGENWDQSTRAMSGPIAQRYPINYQMDLNNGRIRRGNDGVAYADGALSEHGQFWTYRAWADWMDASNWDELKRNHTPIPQDGDTI